MLEILPLMNPASRTPEGRPNRCAICGSQFLLEPSDPAGDALCPSCNSLVWFAEEESDGSVPRGRAERQKQEIRGLVTEISILARTSLQPTEFFQNFLQRVVQSLAAVGGAAWLIGQDKKLHLASELNVTPKLLDSSSDDSCKHSHLLDYALARNSELAVPPLSGGIDESMGGNPTRQLLLLHPLRKVGPNPVGLIEIFQRPNSSPASERGYLIFLKQMCRLGSEYLAHAT